MQGVTGLEHPNSVMQMKDWLSSKGIETESLDKKAVKDLLPEADADVADVLANQQVKVVDQCEVEHRNYGKQIWAVIVYLAIACTAAGYLLQNHALRQIPARTVALLQCACPVCTAVFSFLILRERLSAAGVIGALIILTCVAAEILADSRSAE